MHVRVCIHAVTNPCELDNGNCSHLCLLSVDEEGFSCACPNGYKMETGSTQQCIGRWVSEWGWGCEGEWVRVGEDEWGCEGEDEWGYEGEWGWVSEGVRVSEGEWSMNKREVCKSSALSAQSPYMCWVIEVHSWANNNHIILILGQVSRFPFFPLSFRPPPPPPSPHTHSYSTTGNQHHHTGAPSTR